MLVVGSKPANETIPRNFAGTRHGNRVDLLPLLPGGMGRHDLAPKRRPNLAFMRARACLPPCKSMTYILTPTPNDYSMRHQHNPSLPRPLGCTTPNPAQFGGAAGYFGHRRRRCAGECPCTSCPSIELSALVEIMGRWWVHAVILTLIICCDVMSLLHRFRPVKASNHFQHTCDGETWHSFRCTTSTPGASKCGISPRK